MHCTGRGIAPEGLHLRASIFQFWGESGAAPSPILVPILFVFVVPFSWPDSGHKIGTALITDERAVPVLWPESGHKTGTAFLKLFGPSSGDFSDERSLCMVK